MDLSLSAALDIRNDTFASQSTLGTDTKLQTVLADAELRDTVIVINSFSKYFGMTGWRLGWCVVPEAMTPIVEKLAQEFVYLPLYPLAKGRSCVLYTRSIGAMQQNRHTLEKRAFLVFSALENMGLGLDAKPDGAFYAYINIKHTGLTAIEFCDALLSQHRSAYAG